MCAQGAFTSVVEIDPKPGNVESLHTLLDGIGSTIEDQGCPIEFGKLRTVHFMRWVILDEKMDAAGKMIPASLVLSTNYDEPCEAHLRELVAVTNPKFDEIYAHCRGYSAKTDEDRVRFLEAHRISYSAFYIGTRNRGVGQIRRESELRADIQTFLDGTNTAGMPPEQLYDTIRARFTVCAYDWVPKPEGVPPSGTTLIKFAALAGIILVLAIVGIAWLLWAFAGLDWWIVPAVAVASAGLAFLILRRYEEGEKERDVGRNGASVDVLTTREDRVVQNQLTNLVVIKTSLFRGVLLRVVLFGINLLGRFVYVRGALGGIPSIHFARWVIVDRGRRLLFFSNFDGSWENYLGDFIDKSSPGLTAIWSNTFGCPRAYCLIQKGAEDEQAFKTWVRENQLVTQVWYSAYRDLSVENINNNTRIRQGLRKPLTGTAAEEWLKLL